VNAFVKMGETACNNRLCITNVVTVFVRDAKEEHRYDSASVNVHVGDLNDNAPVLAIASCQSVSVSENVRYDTLHRFIAFDNDTDINGLVTFSIQGRFGAARRKHAKAERCRRQ
jgi:hypothetical protein